MINNIVNTGFQPTSAKAKAEAVETTTVEVPAEAPETEQPAAPDSQQLEQAVSKLNDYVQNIQRTLAFSIEENTGETIIQVYDSETEELIRQIPSEETIKLAAILEDQISSMFVNEQV